MNKSVKLPKYERMEIKGKPLDVVSFEDFTDWMEQMGYDPLNDEEIDQAATLLDKLIQEDKLINLN